MREPEWRRLVRPLLPESDGWAYRGKLAYRIPLRWVILGVLGESSGFGKTTYIWRVRSPLLGEPTSHLDLSYSDRVGGGASSVEDADPEALRVWISRAAETMQDEEAALRQLRGLSLETKNARVYETVAYAQIVTGDFEAAKETFARARALPRDEDVAPEWVGKIFERLALVEAMLSSDPSAALRQLDQWADSTASSLRIERSS